MIERIGSLWTALNTLAFIKDELTQTMMLHQLWIDSETGLTEWRIVPQFLSIAEARASGRNPSLVGRVIEETPDDALAIEDEDR